jgi:hypothetical protein
VIVANARQVQLIYKRKSKTDRSDALLLARLGRFDATLLAPVRHRSRSAQLDLACLRSRDMLVSVGENPVQKVVWVLDGLDGRASLSLERHGQAHLLDSILGGAPGQQRDAPRT